MFYFTLFSRACQWENGPERRSREELCRPVPDAGAGAIVAGRSRMLGREKLPGGPGSNPGTSPGQVLVLTKKLMCRPGLHMSLALQGSPASQARVVTILPPQHGLRHYSLKSIFPCVFIISPPHRLSSTPEKYFSRPENYACVPGDSYRSAYSPQKIFFSRNRQNVIFPLAKRSFYRYNRIHCLSFPAAPPLEICYV